MALAACVAVVEWRFAGGTELIAERNLIKCTFICHEYAVMSPGTERERPDISLEACRLEVRRNAGRGTV
jgi:hypothetical protein